ncbi:endonuclease/exonuclease/phosphatase family protein [Nocardioides sp.]|uniref:endonuclease/exonuclease/phosphatase family protein n=1 Tax=Nocardioides sp. TaxID=35761 RepID=UPI0026078190|nr:endonuclease/exonuclease/phosphatase family protein [Nocardioides sp.]MDI6910240.1 endonuclease/exonuclease/phosphatase family protein [Nocardioides sp.]
MRARAVVFWVASAVLLVPAALLTLARTVEPPAAWWIQLEAFTPFGTVLYAGALLVAAGRLLVRRRWRTPASAALGLVSVAAVAGLVLHCWWLAPLVTGVNPPPAPGAERLTVMTANIAQGDGDPFELVRLASEAGVRLLVVEEITPADLADMERAGLSDLLPYRTGEPRSGGHGTMVFAATELGRAERTATWHDGWVVSMGDLVVVATHPQAPTEPELWRSDHAALLDTVRQHDPDLVLGDFNATDDHAPMRALADAGLRDAAELADEGWQPTWPAGGRWRVLGLVVPPLTRIDHVLVGPRLAAVSVHTAVLPGSDHRAVIAVVARR